MADVVLLHVGPPKTGTTYLQDRLYLNRQSLARNGVRYPVGTKADMFAPALDLIDHPWGGMRPGARGEWENLARRVRRTKGGVVLSHEVLAGATVTQARRAVADLAPAKVHLVLTARDVARQVTAEWQERLKHRRRLTFAKFLRRIQSPTTSRDNGSFWGVQDLPDITRRWADGWPADRVHLVTVPPRGTDHGVLWGRFCSALGIDPAWAPQDTDRRNPSIGIAESTLLRELNTRLKEAGLASSDYRAVVRHRIVHETLAQRAGMTPIALPPDALDWADSIAERWVDWAKSAGIDVVGDLEDLRPARAASDQPWRDPDHPRSADVASAALDALVAVVLEAARRPDTDDRLTTLVGKLSDRVRLR